MKQCFYCKSYVDENAVFCTECGKRLIKEGLEINVEDSKIPNFNNKKPEIKHVLNPKFVLKPAQPNNNSQKGLEKVKKTTKKPPLNTTPAVNHNSKNKDKIKKS